MKTLNEIPQRRFLIGFGLLCFAVFCAVMACAPFLSDDYQFASRGLHTLSDIYYYCLHYGNGRLFGNVGNILLLNNAVVRAVIKAGTVTALILILPFCGNCRKNSAWLFSFMLLAGVSATMFSQVYTWTSGFQNYVPPVLLLLICYLFWRDSEKGLWIKAVLLLLCAFSSQLFVEHSSIANLAAAILALIFSGKNKKRRVLALCWLSGCILGGAWMILFPRIFEDFYQFTAAYQQTQFDSLNSILTSMWTNSLFLMDCLANNFFLCLATGLTSLSMLSRSKSLWKHVFWQKIGVVLAVFLPSYALLQNLFFSGNHLPWSETLQRAFFAILFLSNMAVYITAAAKLPEEDKSITIIAAALALFAAAPLLLVQPSVERCLYLSYTILCAGSLPQLEKMFHGLSKQNRQWIQGALCAGVLCLSLGLVTQFANIHKVYQENLDYIAQEMEKGSTEILLCQIPSDYTFNNTSSYIGNLYYYEEPNDITFTFTDYNSWTARLKMASRLQNADE